MTNHLLSILFFILLLAAPLLAQSTAPTDDTLPPGWEQIDQRLVFLTVQLSTAEASLSAVKKALGVTKYQQGIKDNHAAMFNDKNQQMDRQGGGPVPWDSFYGTTAMNFYYHPTANLHATAPGKRVDIQINGDITQIQRPPQFDYIYKANSDAAQNAQAQADALGQQFDKLNERRLRLEDEQSALWCRISFRAIASREVTLKPLYVFETKPLPGDQLQDKQQLQAIQACRDFMRLVDKAIDRAQKGVDQNQAEAYVGLHQAVAAGNTDLKKTILKLSTLVNESLYTNSPLAHFMHAAKRLDESSQDMTDAYKIAGESEIAADQGRKEAFRGELQRMLIDFSKTYMTADQSLGEVVKQWAISFDTNKPLNDLDLPPIVAETQPSPAITPVTEGSTEVPPPDETPVPGFHGQVVDLLKLLNLKRDTIAGHWHVEDAKLSNEPMGAGAQIRFPYRPPLEYDYHLVYDRESADWGIMLTLMRIDKGFGCGMPDLRDTIGSVNTNINEPLSAKAPESAATHCDVVIQVRKHRLTIIVNGEKTIDQEMPTWEFHQHDASFAPNRVGLGLVDWYGRTIVTKAEVTEISGPGKILGHVPSK